MVSNPVAYAPLVYPSIHFYLRERESVLGNEGAGCINWHGREKNQAENQIIRR